MEGEVAKPAFGTTQITGASTVFSTPCSFQKIKQKTIPKKIRNIYKMNLSLSCLVTFIYKNLFTEQLLSLSLLRGEKEYKIKYLVFFLTVPELFQKKKVFQNKQKERSEQPLQ